MRRADSRGSAVPPPPPPRLGHSTSTIGRSGSTDKLLRLKQRADRAAGKREAEEEVEAGFRSALLEIVFYLFFVLIFGLVTWVCARLTHTRACAAATCLGDALGTSLARARHGRKMSMRVASPTRSSRPLRPALMSCLRLCRSARLALAQLSATDAAYPYASKIANVVSGDPPLSFSDVYQEARAARRRTRTRARLFRVATPRGSARAARRGNSSTSGMRVQGGVRFAARGVGASAVAAALLCSGRGFNGQAALSCADWKGEQCRCMWPVKASRPDRTDDRSACRAFPTRARASACARPAPAPASVCAVPVLGVPRGLVRGGRVRDRGRQRRRAPGVEARICARPACRARCVGSAREPRAAIQQRATARMQPGQLPAR